LSSSELAGLHREGLDIQLHTHRHRLPEDPTSVMAEIADNRRVLEPIVGQRLVHLCYPSGVWSEKHWPALKEAGIETATTCEPGINYPTTPMLRLHRFLDGQDVPALDFEAEVSGFKEVARRFFGRARNAGAPIGAATY
jgi:peptidoglycan/xylan/chitin deacetylase (PgdA/CDA1 family)